MEKKDGKTTDDTRRLRHHEEAMGDHRHGSFQCEGKTMKAIIDSGYRWDAEKRNN